MSVNRTGLRFIKAEINHFPDFFSLRSEAKNIFWSGFSKPPEKEGFRKWYEGQLDNKSRTIYIAYNDQNQPAGYLYLDQLEDNIMEIGYGISEKFEGNGFGTATVAFAKELFLYKHPAGGKLVGWVAEDNLASVKVFLKNGFQPGEQIEKRHFALDQLERTFRIYTFAS